MAYVTSLFYVVVCRVVVRRMWEIAVGCVHHRLESYACMCAVNLRVAMGFADDALCSHSFRFSAC